MNLKKQLAAVALAFWTIVTPITPLALPGAVIGLSIGSTACPKPSKATIESSISKAAKASAEIAARYVEVVDFVAALYPSVLSLETKDKIAEGLITFGENGKKFNALLRGYIERRKNGEQLPSNIWSTIAQNFDQLSAQFLKVLAFLPQAQGLGDSKAFRAISAAVLVLAQVLASNSIIPDAQRIQLETEASRYGL